MDIKSQGHILDIILNRNDDLPNHGLFLGAGTSRNSGVRSADDLVSIWREQYYAHSAKKLKFNNWVKKQSWYNTDEEYAHLFETLYDEPSQRRDYIENELRGAAPGWGYVYLASLLQSRIFNTVFTTNFDDLINEACYLYTDGVRPVVCAYDSEVSNLRLTRQRAKLIKLHGDFLFDSMKNTKSETNRLTRNMEMKLAQFGQEYGLVVVGYGGRDNSVMSILERLLVKRDYFKHGIYWCIRKGEQPRKRVEELLKKKRVYAVEIEGFDEFMAALHHRAGLELPAPVINPMQVAERRSKIFCSIPNTLLENVVIRKDVERVLDGLGETLNSKRADFPKGIPVKLKAAISKRRGDIKRSLEYFKLAVAEDPSDSACAYKYAGALTDAGETNVLREFLGSSSINDDEKTYFMLFIKEDNALIGKATKVLQKEPGNLIARINRAIAYKRLKMISEMNKDLEEMEQRELIEAFKAGIAALKKDKGQMLKMLKLAFEKRQMSLEDLKTFPVFEDYKEDSDLKKFIQEKEKGLETTT